MMTDYQKTLQLLKLFKLEGKTADEVLTESQVKIIQELCFRKDNNRLQIITPTQYGKSLSVALAAIIISCIQDQIVAVVAPTNEKAKIIMRKYTEHLGDNVLFYSQLEKNTKLERLRMEESKERIILREGGGIYVLSVQAGNTIKGVEAAMGEGAKIVIQDESCLIPDQIEATVFRMIGGHKDGFYCKIGNPFYRNHFWKTWHESNYKKIFVDDLIALKEGRYTEEFLEEAKKKPLYDVLFRCKFPEAEAVDSEGWSPLITDKEYENALVELPECAWFGDKLLGHDVARGGGNFNVWVLRTKNYATIIGRNQDPDLMSTTGTTIRLGKEKEIISENWFIDDIGTGGGEVDRLREQRYNPHAVDVSNKAIDDIRYFNKRAENYWKVKQWLNEGGKLDPNCDWTELLNIRYKAGDSSGKLQIMPKDKMRKRGIESPDIADALMLTFDDIPFNVEQIKKQELRDEFESEKPYESFIRGY